MLQTSFLPAQTPASPWLMIMLHGLGDSLEGFRWLPGALRISWLNYLLVNAPDPYYGGFSWYDYSSNPRPGIVRSRRELSEVLALQKKQGFPASHTFLSGFSQGCLMMLETGLRSDELFAGLIGISGYIFDLPELLAELSPLARKQRILLTHGVRDTMIPCAPVRQQVQELKKSGLSIEWHEFDKGHTIAGEEELRVIRTFILACA